MKFFVCLGLVAIAALQYSYWLGDAGHIAVRELTEMIETEKRRNDLYGQRNRRLANEIEALTESLDAVEARARTALGMITEGETFYLVVDDTPPEGEGEDGPREP